MLLDCALRPEECFRLRPENVRDGVIEIQYGKTDNARRRIPMTPRVTAIVDMRLVVPRAYPERPYRAFKSEEAARKRHQRSDQDYAGRD